MIEDAKSPVDTSGQDSVDPKENNDQVAYETYKKVLGEKKKRDAEIAEMREKVAMFEQAKLEAEGKKDDVISSLRSELVKVKEESESTKRNFVWSSVQNQLKSAAAAQGCVNPDKFVKLLDMDQVKALEIDDSTFKVNNDDLSRLIEGAKKDHADIQLFKSKKVNVNDIPSGKGNLGDKPKTLKEMSHDELKAELARQGGL